MNEAEAGWQEEPPTKKIKIARELPRRKKPLENTEFTKEIDNEINVNEDEEEPKKDSDDFTCDPDFDNFVTNEELDKLKEFAVLDEVKDTDQDSNDDDSDSSDEKSEDGVPEDEIEKMLEEDLPDDFKGTPPPKEKPYVTRQKIVLEEKGVNHWESLPLDWMMVRHYSGMPIYMHRTTRVCTVSKPYFLGKGNTRRHDIPISAIPCLAYSKALDEERKQLEIDKKIEEQIRNGTWVRNITQTEHRTSTVSNTNLVNDNNSNANKDDTGIRCPVTGKTVIVNGDINNINASKKKSPPCQSSNQHKNINEDVTIELEEGEISGANDREATRDRPEAIKNKNPNDDHVFKVPTSRAPVSVSDARKLQEEKANAKNDNVEIPKYRQPVVLPDGAVVPAPKVENINTSWKTQHLSHEQINEYCRKLFIFKTVNIMHYNRWEDRRKYTKARKTLQYPTLPEGTKLITIPAPPNGGQDTGGKPVKRDWVMNMDGRSYLSVFHEYVRRALQKQPVYEFEQLENAATPYQATVYIGGMQYGVGHGSSKRQAKSAAARASIQILIPEMKEELEKPANSEPDFSFFDQVEIQDPRISEFCAATCEPSPHAILRTCLLRNFGASDKHIQTEMKKLEYQKIELTMKVGKHSATVICKNKKTAKQRASQAILQALHPHVRSWGSLLRLYGSRSVKSCKEKKMEEQQITLLQDKARHNQPNYAVLTKLRNEMIKLRDRDRAVVPIGTLLLEDDLPTHSGSNLNNVDL